MLLTKYPDQYFYKRNNVLSLNWMFFEVAHIVAEYAFFSCFGFASTFQIKTR